jgi:hypothetical protein
MCHNFLNSNAFFHKIFSQVHRNEGAWPYRRGLEILQYYRKKLRPEIYEEVGGLLVE